MSSSKVEIECLKVPFEEIKLATANFSAANYVGGGGFGKVYKGKLPDSRWHGTVAIKQLNPDGWQGNHEFWNEVSMLYTYRHKNIVSLIGYCDEGNEKIIVYEYAINGSLDNHLIDKDKMRCITWEQRIKICIGAAEGLNHLHSGLGDKFRVIHRDVKSSNILLNGNLEAKISDFGLSKFGPRNQPYTHINTRVAGTPGYLDPLYYRTDILTKESDVYSFGVVLFEVLSGRLVFPKKKSAEGGDGRGDDDDSRSLVALVDRYKDKLDQLIDPCIMDQINLKSFLVFKEIACQCLEMDYKKRPDMPTVVEKLKEALKSQVGEPREEAQTHPCAADDKASDYSAFRSLFEWLKACAFSGGVDTFAECLRGLSQSLSKSANDNGDDGTSEIHELVHVLAEKVGVLATHRVELIDRYTKAEAAHEQLTKELKKKRELVNTLYMKFQSEKQTNKEKISFGGLNVHEIAAFVLNAAGHYEAINRNSSHYYLSLESVFLFTNCLPHRPTYIVGQIVHIERQTVKPPPLSNVLAKHSNVENCIDTLTSATTGKGVYELSLNSGSSAMNPYGLPVGCEYFIVTAAMLPETTIHSRTAGS